MTKQREIGEVMAGNVGKAAKHAMRCCCFQPGLQKYKRTKIRQRSFSWFPHQSFRSKIFPRSQLFVRRRRVKNASPALNRIYCSLSRESSHSCGEYQPLCGLIAVVTSFVTRHKMKRDSFGVDFTAESPFMFSMSAPSSLLAVTKAQI